MIRADSEREGLNVHVSWNNSSEALEACLMHSCLYLLIATIRPIILKEGLLVVVE